MKRMTVLTASILALVSAGAAHALTSVQGGNWSDDGTWGGSVPGIGADVVVASGHSVTVDVATASLNTLTSDGTLVFTGWENALTATEVTLNGAVTHLEQSDVTGTAGVYGDWTPDARVLIVCSNLTVSGTGSINADAKGYVAGTPSGATMQGRGPGGANGSDHGGGGTYGGKGTLTSSGADFNRPTYGNAFAPTDPGSSGASAWNYSASAKGGNGGGAVRIEASGRVTVAGAVSANGQIAGPNGYTSGAGSGGSVFIECATFTGSGSISARGGNGQTWSGRLTAGGGGGRVAVLYDPVAQDGETASAVTFDVGGGYGGHTPPTYGEPGSLYLSDTRFYDSQATFNKGFALFFRDAAAWDRGALTVDNVWVKFPTNFPATFGGALTVKGAHGKLEMLEPADVSATELVVTNSGRLYLYAGGTAWPGVDYGGRVQLSGDLAIYSGSHLYPYSHFSNGVPLKIELASMLVAAGGSLDASAKGYRGAFTDAQRTGYGPPGGGGTTTDRSGGGSHGGLGGYCFNYNATTKAGRGGTNLYGSASAPTTSGSCGGNGSPYTGTMGLGGGVVWIDALGEVRVDGSLNANGGNATAAQFGGGGAGGSVYVTAETFKGAGQLLARGGNGGPGSGSNGGGGGGGGRIAIYSSFSSEWSGTYTVTNGTQDYTVQPYGTPGTYVFEYITPARPGISNAPPVTFSTADADLPGYLFTTGRYDTAAFACWGTEAGGEDTNTWQHVEMFAAPQQEGPLSTNVALPEAETMYYYRYFASNAGGESWAGGTESFLAGHVAFNTLNDTAYREFLRPATVLVSRASSAVNGDLTVGYTVGGTAEPGLDYVALSGSILLAEGVTNAPIVIQPLYRELPPEGDKTITLTLDAGNYLIGTSNAVAITFVELFIPPGPNTNLNSGAWGDIATWSLNRPPALGDDVTIAHDVTVNVGVSRLASLTVQSGKTLTFSGAGASVTAETVVVYGNLTHTPNTATAAPWTPDSRVHIVCDAFTLAEGGAINLDGKGYAGSVNAPGYGPGGGGKSDWAGGGGHNNAGGTAGNGTTLGGAAYGTAEAPVWPGSSGGSAHPYTELSGAGGGVLRLDVSGHAQIDGPVSANGATPPASPANTCGGGSGGSLFITCETISGSGSFAARGGSGRYYSPVGYGGAGSGGRIAVVYDTEAQEAAATPAFVFDLAGGFGGPAPGATVGPGSLYLSDGSVFDPDTFERAAHLIVAGRIAWAKPSLTVSNVWLRIQPGVGMTVAGDVTVHGEHGRLELLGPSALECANLSVTNRGAVWFYAGPTNGVAPDVGGLVQVAAMMRIGTNSAVYPVSDGVTGGSVRFEVGSLKVDAGGSLSADSYGFRGHLTPSNRGRGSGGGYATDVGAGAGYGGIGGIDLRGNSGGPAYGSETEPKLAGSAGGRGNAQPFSGPGGGLVWVEASRSVAIDGTVSARGGIGGGHSGGGSGGGIYIRTARLTGGGSLRADGGAAGVNGEMASGAGGGRIAVWRVNGAPLATSVQGGAGFNPGTDGTVYWGDLPSAGTVLLLR